MGSCYAAAIKNNTYTLYGGKFVLLLQKMLANDNVSKTCKDSELVYLAELALLPLTPETRHKFTLRQQTTLFHNKKKPSLNLSLTHFFFSLLGFCHHRIMCNRLSVHIAAGYCDYVDVASVNSMA